MGERGAGAEARGPGLRLARAGLRRAIRGGAGAGAVRLPAARPSLGRARALAPRHRATAATLLQVSTCSYYFELYSYTRTRTHSHNIPTHKYKHTRVPFSSKGASR